MDKKFSMWKKSDRFFFRNDKSQNGYRDDERMFEFQVVWERLIDMIRVVRNREKDFEIYELRDTGHNKL